MAERSAQSYEEEIARLEKALSEECENSLRLARELEDFKIRTAVTLVNMVDQGDERLSGGYIVPEGDKRCDFVMDACICMKRKGHDGRHACAHGVWRRTD